MKKNTFYCCNAKANSALLVCRLIDGSYQTLEISIQKEE